MDKISLEPSLVWAFPWWALEQFTKHTNLQGILKCSFSPNASILVEGPLALGVVGLAGVTQFLHNTGGRASSGSCPSVKFITQHLTEPRVHHLHLRSPCGGRHTLCLSVMAAPFSITFPCGSLVTLTSSSTTPQVLANETIFLSAHISLESLSLAWSLQIPEPRAAGKESGGCRGLGAEQAGGRPHQLQPFQNGGETWGKVLSGWGCLMRKGDHGYMLKSKMDLSFSFRAQGGF